MMDTLPQRLSFSTSLPALQLAWDSTSLGALKTCPRYYEYSILHGFVPRIESVHLTFGLLFHAALEEYDRDKANGIGHEDALLNAVRYCFVSTWNEALGRPWSSDEPTKTRETLIRSVIWYLDQFENDPCETVMLTGGKPAVELSFRFEPGWTSSVTGEEYLLCGHLDRLVRFQDRLWIVDRKTTKSTIGQDYFGRYSPDNQVSLYTVAGNIVAHEPVAGLIIDAGQIAVTFTRFQRAPIGRTKAQLDEWMKDTEYWIRSAEHFATANHWPQNDKACGLYGGCPYRTVCGSDASVRDKLLESLYARRAWDPLQPR